MALISTSSTNLAPTLSRSHRCPHLSTTSCAPSSFSILVCQPFVSTPILSRPTKKKVEKAGAIMFSDSPLAADLCATAISGVVAVSVLKLWEETAKRGVFDQVMHGV